MPTLKVQVSDYKVLIPVAVSKSYPSDSPKVCDALLDTGAQRTFVSRHVVSQLAAHSVGQIMVQAANGPPEPTDCFDLNISIVLGLQTTGGSVFSDRFTVRAGLQTLLEPEHDVILGMDILTKLDIVMRDGQVLISIA